MNNNLSIIVAISENNAIGRNGDLLCHLSADLKHFKEITMGHTIIMGRKTFESLPKGALPGRKNVVVSRNASYSASGAIVFNSINDALKATENDPKRFIIGGAQLYEAMLPLANMFYLTRIHATFEEADTFFPLIDSNEWLEISSESHSPDERNPFPYTFVNLIRK